MPLDVRKLIFSEQDLHLAFQSYVKEMKLNVSDQPIQSVSVILNHSTGSSGAVSKYKAVLNFKSKDPNTPNRVNLEENQILDALINMCAGLKIPLPRKGKKYLQQGKGTLAMTIGLSEQDIRGYMSVAAATAHELEPEELLSPPPQPEAPKPAAKLVRPD